MSGIAGIWNLDGAAAQQRPLRNMLRSIQHRGPDRAAVWSDGPVGLGQCTLTTTTESIVERQPLLNRTGHLVLTADARIDNRDELRDRLGWRDRTGSDLTDGSLILGAYERWGTECPAYVSGAFAFAIWDERRRQLFCARDHFGIRPFYYWRTPSTFALGSEVKALLALPQVSRRLNEPRIADFLLQTVRDKESSFYRDILRLPPAHSVTVSPEGVRMQEYWSLDYESEPRQARPAENAAAYRERFVEAVRSRLRSAFPVGCLLSGGLDSSSITCVTRALRDAGRDDPVDTFSLVFDEIRACDERPFIQAVVQGGGITPHYIAGDALDPFDELDRMLWHVDEPFLTPNLFLHWRLYRAAGDAGIRVLLDGFLGDNVVSHGSRYLTELAAAGRWLSLARQIRRISGTYPNPWTAGFETLRRFALSPLLVEPARHAWRGLRNSKIPVRTDAAFVNRDLLLQSEWITHACANGVNKTARTERDEHYAELTSATIPAALEIADKAAAAFGLETRLPFADRRLVEFCFTIPTEQKYHDGWTRMIVRRALADYLPERVRMRFGKTNLHPVFRHSLLSIGYERLNTVVEEGLDGASDYVDVKSLQQTFRKMRTQRGERSAALGPHRLSALWMAVVFARWLDQRRENREHPAQARSHDAIHWHEGRDAGAPRTSTVS